MPIGRLRAGEKHVHRDQTAKSVSKGVKTLEPGDEVELTESQAKAWADKFDIVGPTKIEEAAAKATKEDAEAAALEVVSAGGGKYNVKNSETGDTLNDNPLSKSEAEELSKV